MKRLLLFLMLSAAVMTGAAQATGSSYQTAAGVKFFPGALTLKHFIKEDGALEGQLYLWTYGFRIAGLYEYHASIKEVEGLKWYAGGGIHLGMWNDRWRSRYETYYSGNEYQRSYVGLDGIIGLDYKIRDVPINLSLDWQPSFNFGDGPGYYGFHSGFGGLGIRYTFR